MGRAAAHGRRRCDRTRDRRRARPGFAPGRRIELPPAGHHLRPRGRRPARAPDRSCSCTAGSRAAASTGSRPSSRSASTSTSSPPTCAATAAGCGPARSSASPTAPTTARPRSSSSAPGPVIAVGYSMGGPVAQLLWRRHRDLVDGLVLCATTVGLHAATAARATVVPGGDARASTAMARVAWPLTRALPPRPDGELPPSRLPDVGRRRDAPPRLAHDHRGRPLDQHVQRRPLDRRGRRADLDRVHDRGPRRARPSYSSRLADAIPGATVHSIADGHLACANAGFADPLARAPASTSPAASPTLPRPSAEPTISAHQRGRCAPRPLAGTQPRTIDASESESRNANMMWPTITTSSR